jgi:predicted HNH restriction endonuclease
MRRCEVCEVSFLKKFGEEYIEAHHRVALGSLKGKETTNTSDDLPVRVREVSSVLHQLASMTPSELRARLAARVNSN